MLFRIFYENTYRDINDSELTSFTIGSGKKDTVSIPDSHLKKGHVTFTNTKGSWSLISKEKVFFRGDEVTSATLVPGTALGISKSDGISVFVIAKLPERPTTIGISDFDEITIGSASENHIVICSRFVSKNHLTIRKAGTEYHLIDKGSTNGTYVNGTLVSSYTLSYADTIILGDVKIVFTGKSLEIYYISSLIRVNGLNSTVRDYHSPVVFKRSPRLKMSTPSKVIEIESPPSMGGKPEINWLSTLLPAFSTASIAVIIAAVMGSVMMLVYSLPMTVVGLIISITNYFRQKKKYATQEVLRLNKYSEHLNSVTHEIEHYQREQIRALEAADPDTNTCLSIASNLDHRLWQRRVTDADFLSVRLGSGKVSSSVDIHFPKTSLSLEEDELASQPQRIYEKYRFVDGAPITCDINRSQVCGIVGPHSDAINLLNTILVQLSTHHCYTDLKTILIYDKADQEELSWTDHLPHVYDDNNATRFVAKTKIEATELIKSFVDVIKSRKYQRDAEDTFGAPSAFLPYYLFVLVQPTFLDKSNPINEFLLRTKNLSGGMIMIADDVAQLPPECNLFIDIRRNTGEVYSKENTSIKRKFILDSFDFSNYNRFGLMLKNVSCEAENAGSFLPKSYSLFDMMGITDITQWDIGKQWEKSNFIETMAAPIGIAENGDKIVLDLHEKSHGPHGIIAGTTGSGKSELLISYIISVAMNYHPYEVSFVIIDFKGGGMVNQLAKLPHLIGTITDLDGNGINRSLASIKAELDKRKRIFAESNLSDNNISEYIDRYKAGEVHIPLPHLVIIVDEFAELKQNQPEFMKELISASRIGRSLGIHLILATQQPGGQVSGEIWTNSRFQISLRAASAEDSTEVIKSPLAFSIKEPGRAYLRVGNNEIFELIQSAYSKERVPNGQYQFETVIDYINSFCRANGIKRLPSIYLPALPQVLDYRISTNFDKNDHSIVSCVGMYDAPEQQAQGELVLNLSEENVIIIGSPQRGKTNLLQIIIRDIAQHYTPKQVNLYVIDFASMILKNFSELNHMGGVVTAVEEEKMENLFKLLTAEIDSRKRIFSENMVSSFSAYKEAGFRELPQIILLIDNFTVMQELYPEESELLISICREGITAGITVVMANAQTGGLGFKYLIHFSQRIALYCNDSGEYSTLFARNRLSLQNIPGRILTEINHQIVEAQVFISFYGEKEIDRVNKIHQFVADCNSHNIDSHARQIPMVPEMLTLEVMQLEGHNVSISNYRIPVGLDYSNMEVVYLDLLRQGIVAISGSEQSGKTNYLRHVIRSLQRHIFDNFTYVYVIDGSRCLKDLYDFGCVAEFTSNQMEAESMIESVYEQLLERKNAITSGEELSSDTPLLMLVLSGEEMVAQLLQNQKVGEKLQSIAKDLKKYKGFVLIGDVEDAPINYASPSILKYLKESHSFIVFDNIDSISLFDIPIKIVKMHSKKIRVGDAFSFIGGKVRRIRTILDSQN